MHRNPTYVIARLLSLVEFIIHRAIFLPHPLFSSGRVLVALGHYFK